MVTGMSVVMVDVTTDVNVVVETEMLSSVVRNVLTAVVGTRLVMVRSRVSVCTGPGIEMVRSIV